MNENPSSRPPPSSSKEPRSAPQSFRPRPSLAGDALLGSDRVARIQMIAAIALGLVLIVIPLYLSRRPRAEPLAVRDVDASAQDAGIGAAAPTANAPPPTPDVTLSDPKVMECHDTGSRKTRPEDCDHLASVEKSFAAAITSAGACLAPEAGGGSVVYLVDVSFLRKRHPVDLTLPKSGRALKNALSGAHRNAAVTPCWHAVKQALVAQVALDGVPHAHARYKIAITASYAK